MKNIATGMWVDITPLNLSKKHKDHPWHFALFYDFPSQRGDGLWYNAFLFRNNDRNKFGIKEWTGEDMPHHQDVRQMATKVVLDRNFREQFLSDDPELEEIWKRH